MTTEQGAVTDGVSVALNDEDNGPEEGTTGPDPEQWANRGEAEDTGFEPAEGNGQVKGPDPAEWGEQARAERGAEIQEPTDSYVDKG